MGVCTRKDNQIPCASLTYICIRKPTNEEFDGELFNASYFSRLIFQPIYIAVGVAAGVIVEDEGGSVKKKLNSLGLAFCRNPFGIRSNGLLSNNSRINIVWRYNT